MTIATRVVVWIFSLRTILTSRAVTSGESAQKTSLIASGRARIIRLITTMVTWYAMPPTNKVGTFSGRMPWNELRPFNQARVIVKNNNTMLTIKLSSTLGTCTLASNCFAVPTLAAQNALIISGQSSLCLHSGQRKRRYEGGSCRIDQEVLAFGGRFSTREFIQQVQVFRLHRAYSRKGEEPRSRLVYRYAKSSEQNPFAEALEKFQDLKEGWCEL